MPFDARFIDADPLIEMPFPETALIIPMYPLAEGKVRKEIGTTPEKVKLRLKRQGYWSTHRWLKNQGYSFGQALLLCGYPNRYGVCAY